MNADRAAALAEDEPAAGAAARIGEALAAAEAAVAGRDWVRAGVANAALHDLLRALDPHSPWNGPPGGARWAAVIATLRSTLERHTQLTSTLRAVRDQTAAELARSRHGHGAARRYLDVAAS